MKNKIIKVDDGDIFSFEGKMFLYEGGSLFWLPFEKYESHEDIILVESFSACEIDAMYDETEDTYPISIDMRTSLEFFDFKAAMVV